MSYQYHAMSNFFNRDNVGLQGFAAFYRVSSLEERAHAQQLMDYQVQPANSPFFPRASLLIRGHWKHSRDLRKITVTWRWPWS